MGKSKTRRFDAMRSYVGPKVTVVKQSICSWEFVRSSVITLALVATMYTFSISLTFYNKKYIHKYKFPLSITMTHLTIKFIIAAVIRWALTCRSGEDRVILEWKPYFTRIFPPGIASSWDIAFSNWSLEYITVSLYTMTKSTVIIFILGFAIVFRLEKLRWQLVVVVLFISTGLFLFTFHSTQLHLEGFLLVLFASFLSGLRWTLAQLVLQKDELGLTNPLDMMYHIQPWMMLALLPLSAAFEGIPLVTTENFFAYQDAHLMLHNVLILFAGAVIAFFLELSEFLLLKYTSSLTLSISGIFKEICTLYLAVKINHDSMDALNIIGMTVCLGGIAVHILLKAVKTDEESKVIDDDGIAFTRLSQNGGEVNTMFDSDSEDDVFNVQLDR